MPLPARSMVLAARFSAGIAPRIGLPAQWYVSTLDGTENTPASGSKIAISTSALASTCGSSS